VTAPRFVPPLLALACGPGLVAIVARTKARMAGRVGPPLAQPYRDLVKLFRKGAVYGATTTWLFRAGPIVGFATAAVAAALVPFGGLAAPLAFPGDLLLLAYVLALGRFFAVLAALDTGSSFEGMGASREASLAVFTEPALVLALVALARLGGTLSLSAMLAGVGPAAWAAAAPALALLVAALLVVFLAENGRLPVDDPTTHLELTMIHEVMVLDHGGPDLALVGWGAAVRLWTFGALLVGLAVPVRTGDPWVDAAAALGGMVALGVLTGLVESSMARLRLRHVPQLLLGAAVLSVLALFLVLR